MTKYSKNIKIGPHIYKTDKWPANKQKCKVDYGSKEANAIVTRNYLTICQKLTYPYTPISEEYRREKYFNTSLTMCIVDYGSKKLNKLVTKTSKCISKKLVQNTEKHKQHIKAAAIKIKVNLGRGYVKRLIRMAYGKYGLLNSDITEELITIKRKSLLCQRNLKPLKVLSIQQNNP